MIFVRFPPTVYRRKTDYVGGRGRIDYTVATDEIARINRTYYPVLDINLAISFDQRSSWAVRKTSPLLAEAADKWHRENINSPPSVPVPVVILSWPSVPHMEPFFL